MMKNTVRVVILVLLFDLVAFAGYGQNLEDLAASVSVDVGQLGELKAESMLEGQKNPYAETIRLQERKLKEMNEKVRSLETVLRQRVEDDVRREEREKQKTGMRSSQSPGNFVEKSEDWKDMSGLNEDDLSKLSDARLNELQQSLKIPLALRHPALSRTTRQIFDKMIESRVKNLTRELLMPFGQSFFMKGEDINVVGGTTSVPPQYVLGPGDALKVQSWTELGEQTQAAVSIDTDGQAIFPIIGPIGAQGLTLGQLQDEISRRYSEKYPNSKAQLSLLRLRKIQVYVTGEVLKPGAQIVPSISTAFHVLYRSGGPTETGSMRNVQVLRDGQVIARFDLYNYFLNGDRSQDIPVNDGDTVFIPAVGKVVSVTGQVMRPAMYELTTEKTLADVLKLAGGLSASAFSGGVKVKRWQAGNKRQIIDVGGPGKEEEVAQFLLQNGDEFSVEKSLESIGNIVRIEGPVNRPGEYSVDSGETLSGLFIKAGGLVKEEKSGIQAGQIIRKLENGQEKLLSFDPLKAIAKNVKHDLALMSLDRVRIFGQSEISMDNRVVKIAGAVRRPGDYIYRNGMSIRDLVLRAQGLLLESSGEAEIARMSRGKEAEVLRVNVAKILKNPGDPDNVPLQPLDRITVWSEGSSVLEPEVITLLGEVKRPGPYALKRPGENLSEVLRRAGGLTPEAFPQGTIFKRIAQEILDAEHMKYAEVVKDDLYRQATLDLKASLIRAGANAGALNEFVSARATDTWRFAGSSGAASEEEADLAELDQASLIKLARSRNAKQGFTSVRTSVGGQDMVRIPIRLELLLKDGTNGEDVPLRNGDQLTIPRIPTTISIIGAVINPSNVLFKEKEKVKYYIDRVGGFSRNSDHSKTLVIRANGEVFPLNRTKKIQRGDIVLVPPQPQLIKKKGMYDYFVQMLSVTQTMANFALTYKVLK